MPAFIFVATQNAGKLGELQQLFAESGIAVERYAGYGDVEETADSYVGNAELKARALAARLRADGVEAAALGDDSGLEVTALGGRPGIYSARFGGPGLTWAQRRDLLRREMDASGSADRSARFVCALVYVAPDGEETAVQCDYRGSIAEVDRGQAGFSYDPLFVDPVSGLTFAELDEREKNRISHRGLAVAALLRSLPAPA